MSQFVAKFDFGFSSGSEFVRPLDQILSSTHLSNVKVLFQNYAAGGSRFGVVQK